MQMNGKYIEPDMKEKKSLSTLNICSSYIEFKMYYKIIGL